ncbi:MAG: tRNA pseudouridine(38-40) synthase TruA [Kiritimatiellia bacterium]
MTSIPENKRFAATVAYDGAAFAGWQVQPGKRTVQGEIEKALGQLENSAPPRIHGSGRTDTGVHARGQVFHVDLHRNFSPPQLQKALNGILPEDIRIPDLRSVSPEFHARYDVVRKQYRYFVYNAEVMPPELRFTRHRIRKTLDLEGMRTAAALLQGEHDFLSFSANRGKPEQSTVRKLSRLEWTGQGPEFCLIAEADGFLYKMVRQLAGALLRVGLGELEISELSELIRHPVRNHLAPTAPPQALFLWQVHYADWRSNDDL